MKGSKRMVPLLDVRSNLLTMVTGRVSTGCRGGCDSELEDGEGRGCSSVSRSSGACWWMEAKLRETGTAGGDLYTGTRGCDRRAQLIALTRPALRDVF